jgi:hypothetical protein
MLLKDFFHHANWLAIAVAAISYFALGALWFSVLFGKPWMAGHNIQKPETPEAKAAMGKQMPMLMIKTFLMNVIMAIGIAILVMRFGSINCMAGIKLGILLSGIGMIPLVMSHMYLMKSVKVSIIDAGYHLVGITLMTIILSVWH